MAKTDKLQYTNALRIICKEKKGENTIIVFGFLELNKLPLERDARKVKSKWWYWIHRGPTIKVYLTSRQLSVKENLMSHNLFVWSSTSSSPPCKSHWRQAQEVCLHRWLKNTSPAQASLVIVVGSLGFALCTRTKEVFFFFFLIQFCKAEAWNSRTVKWLSSIPLLYVKPAFILFCSLVYSCMIMLRTCCLVCGLLYISCLVCVYEGKSPFHIHWISLT